MLHEDLIDVMPAVEEANSISEELDKRVKFEIILIAPNMLGKLKHKHEGFEDRDKTSSQPEVSLLFQSGLIFTNYCVTMVMLKLQIIDIWNICLFDAQVCVKMKNLENGTEFIWPKEKFLNRLYLMKEMYNNYEEEDDDWDLPEVISFTFW